MKEYAKWAPIPKNGDDMIKYLRKEGFLEIPEKKPAKHRSKSDRSASRQRTPSRGRTSAATEVMLTGLPESLHLDNVNKDRDPPSHVNDVLVLEPEYQDMPAAPNNFTDPEVMACAAHLLRARHGVKLPPQYVFYKGTRADLEHNASKEEDAMIDGPVESKEINIYELYDKLGEDAGLIVPRPDYDDCMFYLATKSEELTQVREVLLQQEQAGWPDIRAFTAAKAQRDALLRIVNFMTCNQTAKPGHISRRQHLETQVNC